MYKEERHREKMYNVETEKQDAAKLSAQKEMEMKEQGTERNLKNEIF